MEIEESESASWKEMTLPSSSNDARRVDSCIGGGGDARAALKASGTGEQEDEEMPDADSTISSGGAKIKLLKKAKEGGEVVGESAVRVSGEGNEELSEDDPVELSVSISGSDVRDEESDGEGENRSVSRYDSLLARFDDYATEGLGKVSGSDSSGASSHGFRVGDMVWGKVKSHPWWPGHIFNEAFATSSVRRTRRPGHILVAFFGDSSYGWFDPTELVPFEENYAEKSRQTSAKAFVKAVEEAVEEVCRRRSVGLSCRCRNPQNFRPANVQGYFAVDLGDYEYVAVYPKTLIDQSRDRFQPAELVRFLTGLAKSPADADHKSLDVTKNRSGAMTLRKAMYEEYDDTYAEAFGHPPERPERPAKNLAEESLRAQAHAQLSGPLVIAEALRCKKSSAKSVKVKDKLKKDRYLLKRRDENDESKSLHVRKKKLDSSASLSYMEGESAIASSEFILQKRSLTTSLKPCLISSENVESVSQTDLDASSENGNDIVSEIKDKAIKTESGCQSNLEDSPDWKNILSAQVVQDVEDLEASQELGGVSRSEAKSPARSKKEGIKKPRAPKRAIGDVNMDPDVTREENKKKKIKKTMDSDVKSDKDFQEEKKKKRKKETVEGHPKKQPTTGKSSHAGSHVDRKEDRGSSTLLSDVDVNLALDFSANSDLKFQDVLTDLRTLALDPFHGAERKSPVITKHVFLKFRSLVYQKSLMLAPVVDSDPSNGQKGKSVTAGPPPDGVRSAKGNDMALKKHAKPLDRPDDPARGGRKRPLSDRQEEIATKKSKKLSDIKSLASEKKASLKALEPQGKEKVAQPRMIKASTPIRRVQAPSRIPEPTMLVLKFPQGTGMPTVAALKARFARFGPLDLESLRVFWQSATCRVVFRYKSDAQKAHDFAVANTSLFGNGNIRCTIREVGVPEPETKEETKEEDVYPDLPRYDPPLPPPSQLKSILKKPSGDEAGQAPPPSKASPRVKFVLDGEEGSGSKAGDQTSSALAGRSSANNNGNNTAVSFGDSRATSFASNVTMDYSDTSRNVQKAFPPISSLPLPPPPPPPPITMPSQHRAQNAKYSEAPTDNYNHHHNNNYGGGGSTRSGIGSVDISQQMIDLLTRCNEVVTSFKANMGYVPYHAL